MTKSLELELRLGEAIDALPVFSTHEHLCYERVAVAGVHGGEWDLLGLFLVHYTRSDLASVGASRDVLKRIGDTSVSFDERHQAFVKYARRCANTTQFRCLTGGLADLYGGDVFGLQDAIRMNTRMAEAHTAGVYDRVLKERAGIQRLVRDCGEEFDEPERFSYAVRLEEWLGVSCEQQVRQLEVSAGYPIHDLGGFVRAMKEHAERMVARGAVAFKSAMIYRREPTVSAVTRYEAECAFQRVLDTRFAEWIQPSTAWSHSLKPLQDYLVRELCDLAVSLAVPLQVHTGLPEGNRLPYTWGHPSAYLGIALDHPSLDVHLLHMGHPFEREACAMAKMYQNVFLDCSWVHQLNQTAATHYLSYALDEVPEWKILGFGGDHAYHEGVYSCLKFARANIVRALAIRVEEGVCSEEDALATARLLLHDNAARLLTRPNL